MTAHGLHSRVSIRQTITSSRSASVLVFLVVSILLVSGVSFNRAAASAPSASRNAKPMSPALRGQEAIDQLKQQGLYSSLQEAMAASRYKAEWQAQTALAEMQGAYELKNPAHNLRAFLTSNGRPASRSTGTQLKTREIANLIDAGIPQVVTLLTAIMGEYEKVLV